MDLISKTLEELPIEIIDGDRGKNYPKQNELLSHGYCLFLSTRNVPDIKFDFSKLQFIDKKKEDVLRSGKLKRGDIVFTTRGTIGNLALYGDDMPYEHIRINSGMVIFRCLNGIDNYFFNLCLQIPEIKKQIKNFSSGTAQPQLPIRDLKKLLFSIPEEITQIKIGKFFYTLDKKISNLEKQNDVLEKIAEVIFKSWFVNFDKVCEFDDSELGSIPKGWEVKKIEEIVKKQKYAIVDGPFGTQMKIFEYKNTGIPIIEMPYLENNLFYKKFRNYISQEKFKQVKRSAVYAGDIIISKTGTLGLLGIMTKELEPAIIVSRLCKIMINEDIISRYYLFMILKKLKDEKYWESISSGSTMPLFNLTAVKNVKVILPPFPLQKKFDLIVKHLYEKIQKNQKLISTLTQTREALLTKLMSGEIRV